MKTLCGNAFALLAVFYFAGVTFLAGQSERVIYRFGASSTDGLYPSALVRDAQGNLYGTTPRGGAFDQGTVFELVRPTQNNSTWTEKILYNFTGTADGGEPSTGLVFDKAGNLYGATYFGGEESYDNGGVIFELSPPSQKGGNWTRTTLFDFSTTTTAVGFNPTGNLAFDASGNLYGVTVGGSGLSSYCGDSGCGVVFQMKPPTVSGGSWIYTDIHDFLVNLGDGYAPVGIVVGPNGTLYGSTCCYASRTGAYLGGAVFTIAPPSAMNGTWTERVVYAFTGNTGTTDGFAPNQVTLGTKGVLFGTTGLGGTNGLGTVFELIPPTSGREWTESILYNFTGANDGSKPIAGVVLDSKGNMYGATREGGSSLCPTNGSQGCGAVYKLTPNSGGTWNETTIYDFSGGEDGFWPITDPLLVNGVLYLPTELGGSSTGNGAGTVVQIRP